MPLKHHEKKLHKGTSIDIPGLVTKCLLSGVNSKKWFPVAVLTSVHLTDQNAFHLCSTPAG